MNPRQTGVHARAAMLSAAVVAGLAASNASGGGRVLWSVQLEQYTYRQFIAVATAPPHAGTIYVTGGDAIYALSPTGEILWTSREAPSDGVAHSLSLGGDGTIYTGMGIVDGAYSLVVAINPDGTTRWHYVPPVFGSLVTGPNVGPDGNIYAMQEPAPHGGLGAFSLDPGGSLRWANVGDLPPDHPADTFITTSDIEFGADRLHTGFIKVGYLSPTIHTFDLAGNLLWSTIGLSPQTATLPIVDPVGRVICSWGQTGMRALSAGGAEDWFTLHPDGANSLRRPAVDSKGVVYVGDLIAIDLWAINPDGTTRWLVPGNNSEIISRLAVSPDDQVLIAQGNSGLDGPHWVRGYAAADGEMLWQVDLLPENGLAQFASAYEPGFAPDSSVVYVTSQFVGDDNDYGYIYAIDLTSDVPANAADINSDGAVNIDDLLILIGLWGDCPDSCPPACTADIAPPAGNCAVDIDDLLMIISDWD